MNALALVAIVVLTDGEVDVQSHASPKLEIDAEAATDVLAANVVNEAPGSGEPAELTAVELGIRALVHAAAVSGHIHADVDYQGRQPIAGSAPNSAVHLLYRAEVSADFLDKKVYVGLGRFVAPSAVLLPVDGLRLKLHLFDLDLQLFGGRRAITTSRGNVDFGNFLPALGGALAYVQPLVQAELALAWSRDEVVLGDGAAPQRFDAFSAYVRATGRPFDWLVAGGELALAQRASYVLGPTWSSVDLRVRTVDIFYGVAFFELRPVKTLRVGYDFHLQKADLFREGIRLDPNDPTVTADAFTPQFIDNRVRVRWRPFELGWLGPDLRFRLRPDWNELRVGGTVDLAPLWALGICLRGSFTYEKMLQRGAVLPPPDRNYWTASLGYRGHGFDVAAGASSVQRSAAPVSSRTFAAGDDSTQPVDLAPFVLEAQRIAFVRGFWGNEIWFAGLDFEQSLADGRERRFFVQLGARLEKGW